MSYRRKRDLIPGSSAWRLRQQLLCPAATGLGTSD